MSNLPVLWVPPVSPPDPDERPPKRRGNGGVLLAATAILGSLLAIVAVSGSVWTSDPVAAPAEKTALAVTDTVPADAREAAVPLPKPAPTRTQVATGPSPETSGGNQPYIASPPAPPAQTGPGARTAAGPDGRPVRVIGIDRPSADMAQGEPSRDVAERRTKDDLAPVRVPAPASASVPAAPEPAPAITAATPRGTIDEAPSSPAPQVAAPSSPAPQVAAPSSREPQTGAASSREPQIAAPAEAPVVAAPSSPSVVRVEAPSVPQGPDAVSAEPAPAGSAATVVPETVPLPPKRVAPPPTPRAASAERGDDFADRLAAIRRAEGRRAVEARPPPPDDDEEEIVVAPRRRWGFVPPFFDERPRGPVLRPYEAPPRVVTESAPHEENCHYHAWPTEDMAFHRTVRCHWHRDPDDPSIRYVR